MHQVGFSYTIVLSVLSLKFKEIIYKISLPIIYKSHSVPVTNTDRLMVLMVLMQTVAVYSANYGKHKNTKCEHYTKLLGNCPT